MKNLTWSLVFLAVTLSFFSANAQKDPIRDEFLDAEFFLAEEDYNEALFAFLKVYNAGNQENANINYRIGICYINIPGEKHQAIPYLEKAVENTSSSYKEGSYRELSAPLDAWLYLGNAYRMNYKLDEAIEAYKKFLALNVRGRAVDNQFAELQIQACGKAKIAIVSPIPVKKENLGRRVNTNQNNFQAVFSGDGNTMAFMTSLRFYDAAFTARKINNNWTNTVNATSQIESDGDQYVTSLSYDGRKMYLVRVSAFGSIIMESDYISGRWTRSKPVSKNINSKFFESHASISPDGNTLYLTSNRSGSLGGMDIFMSEKDASGNWGVPVNLGGVVNTPFNEESPFICNDGKTLFFSSQGHESIGGYDIFYTVRQDDGTWLKPIPLSYPVNTPDDDLYFFPVDNGKGGYMTYYDKESMGSGDIYFINLEPGEELAVLTDEEIQDTVLKEDIQDEIIEVEAPEISKITEEERISVKYLIKPIYFEFDKSTLSTEAFEKLDVIVNAMKLFPDMVLEVRGHTDAIGSYQYNQMLSEKRAKSVTNYLVSKEIKATRLKAVGLSQSEPAAANRKPDGSDSPDGRRFNRRVEFRVLVNPNAAINIQPEEIPEKLRLK